MKKLTLVSVMCRNKIVRCFCLLSIINGKAILPTYAIDQLFWDNYGFTPQRGETITIGI